jgi:N-acetylglucosaminyldiphosphoundecaprenol N-acetyl-beta-D-mannosaminyltransferase
MRSMAQAVSVLGVRIDPVTWEELRERVIAAITARQRTTVMYANVHVLNTAQRTPALVDALNGADLVYCDGVGVRMAARLTGQHVPERLTAADFIWDLARRLGEISAPAYWLGAAPGVAEDCMQRLAERAPGFVSAGARDGFFAKQGPETDEVIAAINAAQPAILFVGMGSPVQELWVAHHRARIECPVVWCIGGTADVVTGVQRRGPDVLTQHGFEWLARLVSDPRRLFGRYVVGNPLFLARVLRSQFHRDR